MEELKLGGIKFPKKLIPKGGNDCVMTPPDLAEKIVEYFKPVTSFLEPCKGEGSFVNAAEKRAKRGLITYIDWCEITQGCDFLQYIPPQKYEWIITNPPFSKFRAFLKKSMKVADNVVFLCTINHIFGLKARLRDIKDAGFYIREVLLCDTPESWPSSGFQVGAILLTKHKGDCKISYL